MLLECHKLPSSEPVSIVKEANSEGTVCVTLPTFIAIFLARVSKSPHARAIELGRAVASTIDFETNFHVTCSPYNG